MIKVYKMNVSGIDLTDKSLYESLSQKRIEKVNALRVESAKKQSAGVELLLNNAVKCEYPDVKIPLKWEVDENGKLFLCDYPQLNVNLSHSGEYAACVVSDMPVGIDIQYMREAADLRIAERFFTESECEHIKKSENHYEVFYRLWTKKESLVKAVGCGLAIPLNSFCVIEDKIEYEGKKYKFTESCFEDYRMCICVQCR